MYVVCKNMTYFIIKLCFAGISQADQAGLEKAPRWAKICSQECLDFFFYESKCTLIVSCGCPCLIEWLVWFGETKGKRGLTLGVMFHSMQRLVHFVA